MTSHHHRLINYQGECILRTTVNNGIKEAESCHHFFCQINIFLSQ
jgi:hypothetical protein